LDLGASVGRARPARATERATGTPSPCHWARHVTTRVNLPTTDLAHWARVLISERVPANVADPEVEAKAAALAEEFVESDPWAREQGAEVDIDHLCRRVVNFARAKGFPVLDEPPCEYPATPEVWIRCWGPSEK
jgi:hypothetical protein